MKRFAQSSGEVPRTGLRKRHRSLLRFSADGNMDIIDLTCGVRLDPFQPATAFLAGQGIKTREDMFVYCHGDSGKNAALSLSMYPDATRESVMPKPEDFISAQFRLLSATVVGAGSWKATDFSNEKMLKASVSKLDRKPVYTDHNTSLDNWAGIVTAPKWDAGRTEKGIKIPGGINATLLIDTKTRPEIARGVLLQAINSNSVTVAFDWEASHPYENEWDFMDMIGNIGKDGKMVCRMVTNINDYHETSLVWLGADPFAKLIEDDGTLVNVDKGNIYSKEAEAVKTRYSSSRNFSLARGYDANVLRLALELRKPDHTPTIDPMKPELLAALLAYFKVAKEEELTADHIKQFTAEVPADAVKGKARFDKLAKIGEAASAKLDVADDATFDKFAGEHTIVSTQRFGELVNAERDLRAAGDVVKMKKDLDEANAANLSLKALAKDGESFMAAKRAELVKHYKKLVGDKADQAVLDTFANATSEQLDGFLKQYGTATGIKFGAHCNKCNSGDHIQMRSSVDEPEKEETSFSGTSIDEAVASRRQGGFGAQKKKD